jgi:hypothetical protein
MCTVPVTLDARRLPALLGGSGLARPLPRRALPALFQPKPCRSGCHGSACSPCATGGRHD